MKVQRFQPLKNNVLKRQLTDKFISALDKKILEEVRRDLQAAKVNDKLFNQSLNVFDRISNGIDIIFGIVSSNNDQLDRMISKDESEEILKKFRW